jgi:large subunit ribosomal protein L4
MRLGAMRSALSLRLKQGNLIVVDALELAEIKTKALEQVLDQFDAPSALIVDDKANDKLRLSARNLPTHMVLPPEGVNLYDVLRHEHLVLSKGAATLLAARFGNEDTNEGVSEEGSN